AAADGAMPRRRHLSSLLMLPTKGGRAAMTATATAATATTAASGRRCVHFGDDVVFFDLLMQGDLAACVDLLRAGRVGVETRSPGGSAPLHTAASYGHAALVRELLARG